MPLQAIAPPARSDAVARARAAAMVAAITAVAAVLRFLYLAERNLWYDETFSVALAQASWDTFRKIVTNRELNMVVFYLLLRAWTLMGTGEFWVRTLSALFAAATVPALYVFAARTCDRKTAMLAAGLLAVHGYHIRYAQEARGYSLLVLLAVLCSLLFLQSVRQPTLRNFSLYVISCVLAAYTHLFAVLLLPVHWISLIFLPRRLVPWTRFLKSTAIIFVALAPLALFVTTKNVGQIAWIPPTEPSAVYNSLDVLAGRGGLPLLAAFALSVALGIAAALKQWQRGRSWQSWSYALLVGWAVLPFTITALASLWKPLFLPRFLIFSVPAIALLAAIGIWRLRPAWLSWAAMLVLVALSLQATFAYYRQSYDPPPPHWRAITQRVLSESAPGDALIFYHPFLRIPFEYYRDRLHLPAPALVYPQRGDAALIVTGSAMEETQLAPGHPFLQQALARPRLWLVISLSDANPTSRRLQAVLAERFPLVQVEQFGHVQVLRYSR